MGMFEHWSQYNFKRGRLDTDLIREPVFDPFSYTRGLDFQNAQTEKKLVMESCKIKKENTKDG
jgi:hypothetical protein